MRAYSITLACAMCGVIYGQAVDSSIRAAVSLAPNLSIPGTTSGVLVTITNQNPSSSQQLQPGDVFRFQFDLDDGLVQSLPAAVTVNSSTLSPAFFVIGQGAGPNEIVDGRPGHSSDQSHD